MKVLAPFIVLLYCLLIHQAVFDGWRGWFYVFQRVLAEMILSARLIEASHNCSTTPIRNKPVLVQAVEFVS